MTWPRAIGLNSQYPRAGKDTVAGILRDLYGYEPMAFADALRSAIAALDPLVCDAGGRRVVPLSVALRVHGGWEGIKSSPYCKEARRLLQRGGTEMGRQVLGQDVWVTATTNHLPKGKLIVFTDMRFPNEWDFVVNQMGGEAWRLVRKEVEIPMEERHLSDTALDQHPFDVTILNEGTVAELSQIVMNRLDYTVGV